MTLLALFDQKQKSLRSQLSKQPNSEQVIKLLKNSFDELYHEYSAAQNLDLRGQRELAFVVDMLKQSVTMLGATSVSSKKVKSSDLAELAKIGRADELVQNVNEELDKLPLPFPVAFAIWPVVKGVLGFFLFAMLWFQSQFFAAFLVLALGIGDVLRQLVFNPKKKTVLHKVSVDSAALLAAVAELIKCADKLLSEKPTVASLTTGAESLDAGEARRLPINLFQELIEARYANDGDLALKRILKLPASLEDMGIQAVDYDGTNAEYFDILPKLDGDSSQETSSYETASPETASPETAMPALIKGNQVLARGRVYGTQ